MMSCKVSGWPSQGWYWYPASSRNSKTGMRHSKSTNTWRSESGYVSSLKNERVVEPDTSALESCWTSTNSKRCMKMKNGARTRCSDANIADIDRYRAGFLWLELAWCLLSLFGYLLFSFVPSQLKLLTPLVLISRPTPDLSSIGAYRSGADTDSCSYPNFNSTLTSALLSFGITLVDWKPDMLLIEWNGWVAACPVGHFTTDLQSGWNPS